MKSIKASNQAWHRWAWGVTRKGGDDGDVAWRTHCRRAARQQSRTAHAHRRARCINAHLLRHLRTSFANATLRCAAAALNCLSGDNRTCSFCAAAIAWLRASANDMVHMARCRLCNMCCLGAAGRCSNVLTTCRAWRLHCMTRA